MEKITFSMLESVFLFILFINSVTAVSINSGAVLNTSISNSSVTFSFNITATNFTVESGSVLIYGISFTNGTGAYICNDINHSAANSNLDSSQFNCALQTVAGTSGGGGSCSHNWGCTNWSVCFPSGKQTRSCTDTSTCSNAYKSPEIEQNCTYTAREINESNREDINNEKNETIKKETGEVWGEKLKKYRILIAAIIILFLLLYLKRHYFKKVIIYLTKILRNSVWHIGFRRSPNNTSKVTYKKQSVLSRPWAKGGSFFL